ncbi:hypothetical protein ANN_11722 [Periplaneta americana]|uniref:Uncharacterized protein n=1 Tax=Periplaneta americana TaxID=6978 RepID=A0ABQ8T7M1_PERAM|nr:hypothetical protein ANN_11722 [Periplaneta americana]
MRGMAPRHNKNIDRQDCLRFQIRRSGRLANFRGYVAVVINYGREGTTREFSVIQSVSKPEQASLVSRRSIRVCVRICVSIRRPEFECSGPQLEGPEFECSGPQLEGPEFEYSELSLKYVFPNSSHSCHYRRYRTYRKKKLTPIRVSKQFTFLPLLELPYVSLDEFRYGLRMFTKIFIIVEPYVNKTRHVLLLTTTCTPSAHERLLSCRSVKTPILISKICILTSKCVPGSVRNKVGLRDKLEQVLQRNLGLKDLRTTSDILAGKNTVYNVAFLSN